MTVRDQALKHLREVNCPLPKIEHSIMVADVAMRITDEIRREGQQIDAALVEAGALLHDVGIAITKDDLSPVHCVIGAQLAAEWGYPEGVIRCIESHEMGGLTRNEGKDLGFPEPLRESYLPQSIEQKVVAVSDVIVCTVWENRRDPWLDYEAPGKSIYPYLRDVYRLKAKRTIDMTHPVLSRVNTLVRSMIGFVKREFIPGSSPAELYIPIVDAHVHACDGRHDESTSKACADKLFAHRLVGTHSSEEDGDNSVRANGRTYYSLLKYLDKNGIERAVVYTGMPYSGKCMECDERVSSPVCDNDEDRLVEIPVIHDLSMHEAVQEIHQVANVGMLKGVRLVISSVDLAERWISYTLLWEHLDQLGMPVVVELVGGEPYSEKYASSLLRICHDFQNTRMVLSHFGRGYLASVGRNEDARISNSLARLIGCPNVWIDIGGLPYSYGSTVQHPQQLSEMLKSLYDMVGPGRMVWGSNYPWIPKAWTCADTKEFFTRHCNFSFYELQLIMGANALQLYDFSR